MSNPYHIAAPMPSYLYPTVPTVGPLNHRSCKLLVRQHPKHGLVTVQGKEKSRKPLDPPPMFQLQVNSHEDPGQQYLQNPYIFGSISLWTSDKKGPVQTSTMKSLTGTLVSSLHRLKDPIKNEEGAYFIFGDISVKIVGKFRLCMTLYEVAPEPMYDTGSAVQNLGFILTDPFEVTASKDFKGLEESTHLSRSFSDQGVRLRLRKEKGGMLSTKRRHDDDEPVDPSSTAPQMSEFDYPPQKRMRTELYDSPVTPDIQPNIQGPLQTAMPLQQMVLPRDTMPQP
ncbi:Velvet domain containing protein [Pyrenophora tritici-repentis]|nr:Velvet domain containing protein [Pyrenophora tritici-repentis]